MASTLGRCGASEQTGSVAEASPASNNAWQRHPPKSCARRSQDLQGSCIHSSPRNFWKASEFSQISHTLRVFTFSNFKPGMTVAAWQGSASPLGVMSMSLRPQPRAQGLGYFARWSGSPNSNRAFTGNPHSARYDGQSQQYD